MPLRPSKVWEFATKEMVGTSAVCIDNRYNKVVWVQEWGLLHVLSESLSPPHRGNDPTNRLCALVIYVSVVTVSKAPQLMGARAAPKPNQINGQTKPKTKPL